MRIGILSDTHDRRERAARAVSLLAAEGAEALLHCGDLTGPEVAYELAPLPCFVVQGNCDGDPATLRHAVEAIGGTWLGRGGTVELGGKRIALTHGHDPRELRDLLSAEPDYLFQGHTHVASDERDGATRRINPGALHRAPEYTVALLDLDSDQIRFVKVR